MLLDRLRRWRLGTCHPRRVFEERGVAAVELVILFPILMLLLLGIVEFGRYYNATIVVTNAAREAVRPVALQNGSAQVAAVAAATPLAVNAVVNTPCPANGIGNAKVTVTASFTWDPLFILFLDKPPGLPPILPPSISRAAVMRCGG